MLGGIGGRRRRGQQRMRWLDGITDSMDVSLKQRTVLQFSHILFMCVCIQHTFTGCVLYGFYSELGRGRVNIPCSYTVSRLEEGFYYDFIQKTVYHIHRTGI